MINAMTTASRGQNEALAPPPVSDISERCSLHLEDAPIQAAGPTAEPQTLPSRLHPLSTHSHLLLFSILGTLSRLGLTSLTIYPSTPLPGLLWAQFAGCLVMGFLLEDQALFPTRKITTPLYLGLSTGYCGSLTSFSSFMFITFSHLSNTAPSNPARTVGQDVLAAIAYTIGTLALSLGGIQAGAHIAIFSRPLTPMLPARWLDYCLLPLGIGSWIAVIFMAVFVEEWRGMAFACVFSPPGAIARFWASRWLNPLRKSFPVGTFVANMVGTAVLAGLVVGRNSFRQGSTTCGVMRGLGDGFCGCLTTVSTFAVEVKGLRVGHAYVYAATSIAVGLGLMVVILGSYIWVNGLSDLVC